MDTEPKKQEPEIVPPAPVVEPPRNVPEIPPDKDTPGKEKSRSSEGWFNSKLKTKQLATAIPVGLILIIVILVLLGSVAASVVDADEVFGSTHCSAACGIFALNGTAAHAGTLSVHQSHTGVVYGPRTR
jgi:hypothetical protein